MRRRPTAAAPAEGADEAMNDLAALNIRLLSVTGEPCGEHLFPPHLKLSFDVSGTVLQVSAACSADLLGGFRSVYLLGPSTRLSAMVFKLGRSVEDNVQEVRSTELCPCAFTRIFAHGGATLQLGDHSVYYGHFILAERVLPLRQVLRTGGIKARTLAMVALGCLQGWCRASRRIAQRKRLRITAGSGARANARARTTARARARVEAEPKLHSSNDAYSVALHSDSRDQKATYCRHIRAHSARVA